MLISETAPLKQNGTLKFVSPSKKKMADFRVRRATAWLVVLKKRKRLSQLRDDTKSSLAPLFAWFDTVEASF